MKVVVVAEFYPRAHDPVLGVWTHRQALAARDAGIEVEVLVLHRPIPSVRALRSGPRTALAELRTLASQPRHAELDGLPITYVPFLAPGRTGSYGQWGRWAAPTLHRALRQLHRRFPFELIHAHNAVPAADALRRRRGGPGVPVVTSVHGGDVFHTAPLRPEWSANVSAALDASTLVLANSRGIAKACRKLTSTPVETLLLGADIPERPAPAAADPTLVTVGHLVPRKRHADVLRAMWVLRDRWPALHYVIVGDGPERGSLERLAGELGLAERVDFRGQLPHDEATAAIDGAWLAVMPSINEAYGVAYVEAMARGVPTIGALGEPGPLELADLRSGIQLAAPGDVEHLSRVIDRLLAASGERARLGQLGRRFVAEYASWEVVGQRTADAYGRALRQAQAEAVAAR